MLSPNTIKDIIMNNLDCDLVDVKGDDGTHFEALIVSKQFQNISTIKQHQLVYRALGNMMQNEIHALSIKTMTPSSWEQLKKIE